MRMTVLCGLACVALAGAAQAALIDFNDDTPGGKPNGWTSNDSPLVHFSDSQGSDLFVRSLLFNQTHGNGLLVGSDDGSWLNMDFDVPVSSLSLAFGNDDPEGTNPGDQAILTAFLGDAQVGQTLVVMNRNDTMDQTISFSDTTFDRATLYYATEGGLTEVVDDICFEAASVPLPGAALLATLGLGTVAWLHRRRLL